jgi:hypothetical protein
MSSSLYKCLHNLARIFFDLPQEFGKPYSKSNLLPEKLLEALFLL